MTNQHRAAPEQWADAGAFASDTRACLDELRARIEFLEATQHAHIDTSHLTDAERKQICEDLSQPARVFATAEVAPIVVPNSSASLTSSPAGLLVERVKRRLIKGCGGTWDKVSCDVILEVAAWFRAERDSPETAAALEQEANR